MPIPANITGQPMLGFSDPKTFFVGYSPSFLYPINGLGWSMDEDPEFNTLDQKTAGGREIMESLYQNPLHAWKLKFNFLENDKAYSYPGNPDTDFRTLYSFFCAMNGRFGEFLFQPRETAVTGQVLAQPDANGYIELVYGLGPFFAESVQELDGATPTIFKNGSDITSTCTFYSAASIPPYSGIVFTTTTPLNSAPVITANFDFFYRAHFDSDRYSFEEFMYKLQRTGIGLQQVRI